MRSATRITERLRDWLIGELHLGRLHAGDRLPGVRELAQESGVGVRAVVRAYRELQREGLVEIRSRSGVYVAPQERLDGEVLEETAQWLADTLSEALKRRLMIPAFAEFIRRCTATVRPMCALLESTEDHLAILESELRHEFGFDVMRVNIAGAARARSATPRLRSVPEALKAVHLVVTTTYHAALGRAIAESLHKPLVVVTIHRNIASALERRLRSHPLTVVCVERGFGDRVKAIYGARYPERVRVVLAGDRPALRALDPSEPVLLTLAASRRVSRPLRKLLPHSPTISPDSAKELAEMLIRINVTAVRQSRDGAATR